MKENIKVFVRIRPLPSDTSHCEPEDEQIITRSRRRQTLTSFNSVKKTVKKIKNQIVYIQNGINETERKYQKGVPTHENMKYKELWYAYSDVFAESSTQEEVYSKAVLPMMKKLLEGYNTTVFAYGATGAGKTYTMSGTDSDPGLMQRCISDLFNQLQNTEFELNCSYLEVYNETIKDLLSSQNNLEVREVGEQIIVPGLSQHQPQTKEEVLELLERGQLNRAQAATKGNAVSSRSHSIFQIFIEQRTNGELIRSCLTLCDLAGSERAGVSNHKQQIREGANINKSLLALGNCINALSQSVEQSHIPYRDSKLTRLLKYSLGGNCQTVMICNICPALKDGEDTLQTLKYGERALKIETELSKNHVQVGCPFCNNENTSSSSTGNNKKEFIDLEEYRNVLLDFGEIFKDEEVLYVIHQDSIDGCELAVQSSAEFWKTVSGVYKRILFGEQFDQKEMENVLKQLKLSLSISSSSQETINKFETVEEQKDKEETVLTEEQVVETAEEKENQPKVSHLIEKKKKRFSLLPVPSSFNNTNNNNNNMTSITETVKKRTTRRTSLLPQMTANKRLSFIPTLPTSSDHSNNHSNKRSRHDSIHPQKKKSKRQTQIDLEEFEACLQDAKDLESENNALVELLKTPDYKHTNKDEQNETPKASRVEEGEETPKASVLNTPLRGRRRAKLSDVGCKSPFLGRVK